MSPWKKSPLFLLLFLKTIYSQQLLFPRTQNQYHIRNRSQTSNHHLYNSLRPQQSILITQRKLLTVAQRNPRYLPPLLLLLLLLLLQLVLLPSPPHLLYLNLSTSRPSFASHLRPHSDPLTPRRSRFSRKKHPDKLNHTNPPNSIFHKNFHPRREKSLLSEKAYTRRLPSFHPYYHHNPPHLNFLLHFLLFLPDPP